MLEKQPLLEIVPHEILGAILELSCSAEDPLPIKDRYRTHIAPITASHVCTTWRETVVSMPQLWTQIFLRVGDGYRDKGAPDIQLMHLFLERSKDRPLFIDLSVGSFDVSERPEHHWFLVKLFSTVARWRKAELDLDVEWIHGDSAWEDWFSAVERAPLLESLTIRVSATEERGGRMKLPRKLWLEAPALRKLTISVRELDPAFDSDDSDSDDIVSSNYPCWTVETGIPFKQITDLLLEGGLSTHISWKDIGEIFGTAPNLVSCFLEGISATPNSTLQIPIVLRHLKYLYFEASGLDGSYEVLTPQLNRTLTAPALKTLSFAYGESRSAIQEPWVQDSYTEFVTRSSCSLEELHFINIQLLHNDLMACLTLSPTLQTLYCTLDHPHIVEFSSRMAQWDAMSSKFVICPLLKTLSLHWAQNPNLVAEMIAMFRERSLPPNGSTPMFAASYFSEPYYVNDVGQKFAIWIQAIDYLKIDHWRLEIIFNYYKLLCTRRRSLWERYGGY